MQSKNGLKTLLPTRPCLLELPQKRAREEPLDTLPGDCKSKATGTPSSRTTARVKGRPRGGGEGTFGDPQSSGRSWGSLGHPPAPPPRAGSLLRGTGWCKPPSAGPGAPPRFSWARQAPKDTLFLTTAVCQGPGRIRGCSGSGRGGSGPRPGGLLPAAPHIPFHPQAAAEALS